MAIQVQIKDAKIAQDGLALTIDTTNSAQPGKTLRFEKTYAVTMAAVDIKAAIDAAVTLLWQAMATPSWTI